jgi:hypothetical protein
MGLKLAPARKIMQRFGTPTIAFANYLHSRSFGDWSFGEWSVYQIPVFASVFTTLAVLYV